MSYAESLLTPDEEIVVLERQHWLALILDSWMAMFFWGFAILLVIINFILPDRIFGQDLFGSGTWFGTIGLWLLVLAIIGGLIVLLLRILWWRSQEFVVTNQRLILTGGILNKFSSDSSLDKINDAQLEMSVLGRLLGYGRLRVLTAAPLQGADLLERLANAKAFKQAMMTAKYDPEKLRREYGVEPNQPPGAAPAMQGAPPPPAPPPAAPPPIDVSGGEDPLKADTPDEVAAVLAELTRLRDGGHISSGEYEVKKQELLDRL